MSQLFASHEALYAAELAEMERTMSDDKTIEYQTVTLALYPAYAKRLDELVAYGVYGPTRMHVMANLVQRGLDDLLRAGVLKRKP